MIKLNTEKVAIKKRSQDYDCNPPRCRTCIYFKQPSAKVRRENRRTGKDEVTMCSFGDFPVVYFAVCNEWRDKNGSTIL